MSAFHQDAAVAIRARWVIPADRPPIDGGIVTIVGDRIAAVAKNESGRPPRDLGDVALLPALVNAHTHLDLSNLTAPLGWPGISFPGWIEQIVTHRRAVAASLTDPNGAVLHFSAIVKNGLNESLSHGVAAVGDIASPLSVYPTDPGPIELTVFLELLGLSHQQKAALLANAQYHVGSKKRPHLIRGLSPHSPYTVSPQLLEEICQLSRDTQTPVAMHLAESREELDLLGYHTGPLVDFLQSLDAWHPQAVPKGLRPLDYLRQLATGHRSLVVHGNYLAQDEIEFIAGHRDRMSLIYCPRTHAYFGHQPYSLAQALAAGVRVAIGTDSRATNPDLRLLEELRHIARHHPSVSPDSILRMGTLAGAEALGLADHLGSITPGKRATLAIIPLSAGGADAHEFLRDSAVGDATLLQLNAEA